MLKDILKRFYFKLNRNPQQIIITPKGARWGNLLYFFLRAYIYKENKHSLKLLYTEHMKELLELFPALEAFVIHENDVAFYHKKDASNQFFQVFGKDFSKEQLNAFIEKYLINSTAFTKVYDLIERPSNNTMTINIRRGDFYENKQGSIYGYDQIGFLKHVFDKYLNKQYFDKIIIISDNMEWCQQNFSFLEKYSPTVEYPKFSQNSIQESFCWITKASNLILSNSTFSFWGAYISNYLQHNESKTYCPIFGSRRIINTDLYQFNPEWNMIRDFDFGYL
ncbi:alpha-1,2-fucosyltransferase [Soonwooa sp.]|uniref:alpha-1,2-fucosyltransferase n=1 Tax=Soonwooa sp. TaxID=1938592 RepID=UPI00260CE470|nr:alpha-1,2-fucosyltransferase [Soonwooa sp.]